MNGKIIHISHDNLPNAIVHVVAANDVGQKIVMDYIDGMRLAGKGDNDDANSFARSKGTVYMLEGIDNLMQVGEKAPLSGNMAVHGPRLLETGARMYVKGNEVVVSKVTGAGTTPKGLTITTESRTFIANVPKDIALESMGWQNISRDAHYHPNAGNGYEFEVLILCIHKK